MSRIHWKEWERERGGRGCYYKRGKVKVRWNNRGAYVSGWLLKTPNRTVSNPAWPALSDNGTKMTSTNCSLHQKGRVLSLVKIYECCCCRKKITVHYSRRCTGFALCIIGYTCLMSHSIQTVFEAPALFIYVLRRHIKKPSDRCHAIVCLWIVFPLELM